MIKKPETLRDVITRVMDTLNSRRQKMCDFFDDFDDREFDDGMEESLDPNVNDDLSQEDKQPDGFTWDEAYWSGIGLGWAYEEGRRERRKRKSPDSDEPSKIY